MKDFLFRFKKFLEIIPLGSVECERLFSAMNFIKDKKKSRLTTRNLFYRLNIFIHGGNVEEFDFEGAFEIWKSEKTRIFAK